ncbi:MAG: hypothetical protein ABL888_12455 [Pirellulaceae bacterium]
MFKKCCVAMVLVGFLCLNLGCPDKPVNGGRTNKTIPAPSTPDGKMPVEPAIDK